MLCSSRYCSCGRSASSRASTPLRSRFGTSYQWPTGCRHCSGHVVGVIAAFARLARPADQGGAQAVPHLLRLLVEQLLRHLLPGKAQIARHRHHAQADAAPWRKEQRACIAVVRSRARR